MNARLLASMDTEPFKEVPDLSPQPQLTNPNMPIPVQPGPVGAKYLAEAPALMPRRQAAPTPAAAMAQPAAQAPAPATALSPAELEDRAFRKKINESAQQYRRTIDARRATRSAVGEYHKLKGQLETAAGSLEDLKGLEKDYAGVYAPDSPALMALQVRQAAQMAKAKRLREQVKGMAQSLNKQYGLKIGSDGGLDAAHAATYGDEQHDKDVGDGAMDAFLTKVPEY